MNINLKSLTAKTLTSESAGNPYLAADGFVNLEKVLDLQKDVAKEVKKLLQENPKLKPNQVAVKSAKRRGTPYSAKSEKAKDLTYMSKRHIKLAVRSRLPTSPTTMVLLTDYEGLSKGLAAKVKQAFAAINSHIKKQPKAADKTAAAKGKIRDAKNKVFDKASDEIIDMLGLKPSNVVKAKGMMGISVVVKLPSGNYVSITGADADRFKAAKKAAAAAQE
jgi:hypothetical protein